MSTQSMVDRTPVHYLVDRKIVCGNGKFPVHYTYSITYDGQECVEDAFLNGSGDLVKDFVPVRDYIRRIKAKRSISLVLMTNADYDAVYDNYLKSLISDPKEIDQERYWQSLDCLPPSRWSTVESVESFHICERITDNLVSWYCEYQGKFYTFIDVCTLDKSDLAKKLKSFISNQQTSEA